jgi:hypothetical protein
VILCRLGKEEVSLAENISYFKSPEDMDLKLPEIKNVSRKRLQGLS